MLAFGLVCAWISVSVMGVMFATNDVFWNAEEAPV